MRKLILLGAVMLTAVLGAVGYQQLGCLNIEVTSLRAASAELHHERAVLTGQLATALRSLDDRTAERDAAESARNDFAEQLKEVIQLTLDQMATVAAEVTTDPRLCSSVISRATLLADRCKADPSRLRELNRSLPLPATIPVGATVELIGVRHDEGAIVIDFVVHDNKGRFITGLSRQDVEVLDSDRRLHALTIVEVSRPTGENQFAVLLDTSSSTSGAAVEAMKRGASHLVRSLANPSRLRLWRFADTVDAISPWTFDSSIHEAAIESLTPKGGTNLYRCIRLAAEDLFGRPGLRSIVLFTDGADSFRQEPVEPVIAMCRSAEIPVHVVALHTTETNEAVLRRIVDGTGGTYHVVSQPERLVEQFKLVAQSVSRPVYRVRLNEANDATAVTMRIGDLKPVLVTTPL